MQEGLEGWFRGFRVWCFGFEVLGLEVLGLGFGVWGLELWVLGLMGLGFLCLTLNPKP